jgi:tRNA 2-thiocytidine biosynthesis protein TtcA
MRASKDWKMLRPGDRLLLGLSGGKDSLALLHVLLEVQKRVPFKFELAACTVDPGTEAFDPSALIPYMKQLGVEYFYERTTIFEDAKRTLPAGSQSYCSYCARMKRGVLYRVARENRCDTLVLAQHLDDFAESFVMSAFRNGQLRTMKANYVEVNGDVRVGEVRGGSSSNARACAAADAR